MHNSNVSGRANHTVNITDLNFLIMALFLADGNKGFQGKEFFFLICTKGFYGLLMALALRISGVKAKTIKIKMNNSTSILKFVDKTHITCFLRRSADIYLKTESKAHSTSEGKNP